MADDTTISALNPAAALDGAEIVPVVQAGGTVRTTVSDIRAGLSDASKLPLSGGILTGMLTVPDLTVTGSALIPGMTMRSGWPYLGWENTAGPVDQRRLSADFTTDGRLNFAASNDAGAWVRDVLQIDHGGTVTVPTGPLKVGANTVWHGGNLTPFNGAYSSLTGIPATFAPSTHTHAYSSLTGVPATFAPSAHAHPATDIYGFANTGVNDGYTVISATNTTLSNGNKTFTNDGVNANYRGGRAGVGRSTGKWYFEVHQTLGASLKGFGVCTSAYTAFSNAIGQAANTWGFVDIASSDGFCAGNSTIVTAASVTIGVGHVVGIAVDLDTGKFWASVNGVWQASGDPATGANAGLSTVAGTVYPASTNYAGSAASPAGHTIRLLSSEFSYAPPAGFSGWADNIQLVGNATTATALAAGSADRTKLDAAYSGDIATSLPFVQQTGAQSSPAAGKAKLFFRNKAGRASLEMQGGGTGEMDTALQPSLFANSVTWMAPLSGSSPLTVGPYTTQGGTITTPSLATTNRRTAMRRINWVTASAATNAVAGARGLETLWRGNAAGMGGFFAFFRFALSASALGNRAFVGLSSAAFTATTDPSANINLIGVGFDAADTVAGGWVLMTNDGSGVATETAYATAPRDATTVFDLTLYCAPNSSSIGVRLYNQTTQSAIIDNLSVTTNFPANTAFLAPYAWVNTGTVTTAIGIDIASIYTETDI
jgi:hypothetical protein